MSVSLVKAQQKFVKKFGSHAMLRASDTKALAYIPYGVTSTCLSLDLALGRPGFPAGRLTEVVGETNMGKSSLSYAVLAECQRQGGVAILLETEQAFEAWRLKNLGVDTEALWLLQPSNVEQMFEMLKYATLELRLAQKFSGPVVMVVDTIANLRSSVEEEGSFDDHFMGATARAMAQGFRQFTWTLAEHKIVLIFLNQLIATMDKWGDKLRSYGGSAIHKNSSARLQVASQKKDHIKVANESVAAWTRARLIKNKLGLPWAETRYLMHFEKGIDPIEDLWQAARKLNVVRIRAKGTQFALGDKSVPMDREKFTDFLMDKFKSPTGLRERLVKVAIEQQLLRPYGE